MSRTRVLRENLHHVKPQRNSISFLFVFGAAIVAGTVLGLAPALAMLTAADIAFTLAYPAFSVAAVSTVIGLVATAFKGIRTAKFFFRMALASAAFGGAVMFGGSLGTDLILKVKSLIP